MVLTEKFWQNLADSNVFFFSPDTLVVCRKAKLHERIEEIAVYISVIRGDIRQPKFCLVFVTVMSCCTVRVCQISLQNAFSLCMCMCGFVSVWLECLARKKKMLTRNKIGQDLVLLRTFSHNNIYFLALCLKVIGCSSCNIRIVQDKI